MSGVGPVAAIFSKTVKFALFVTDPQLPLTITSTVWLPRLNEPVPMASAGPFVPTLLPSSVHTYENGPVPEAVVEYVASVPWQVKTEVNPVAPVLACTVRVELLVTEPQAPVITTSTP